MRWEKIGALILAGALGACAQGAPAGDTGFGATFGTPFLLALKAPLCIATVALSAPLVGASGFAPTPQSQAIREDLDAGMAANCGPPYVFTAQR
jgi:hypothetical protein